MFSALKDQIQLKLTESLKEIYPESGPIPEIELEVPADKDHGDLSCNIALKSAKILKKKPISIAEEFLPVIEKAVQAAPVGAQIAKIEVKNPGFINFFFSPQALYGFIEQIYAQGEDYGRSDQGKKEKIQIEFVSANPTGPLSIAHARQAAVGDALTNILKFISFDVTKEYYLNDQGNQINILGQSIKLRAAEILGQRIDFPEDGYQGEYIKDMARAFLEKKNIKTAEDLEKRKDQDFRQFGVTQLMDVIEKELEDFGVHFDVFSSESAIATDANVEDIIKLLSAKKLCYEKDGALWFASTQFGDDKDRVLKKSDGSYTYLAPDIVYHKDKFDRGFSRVFNIWGPDHHGYIPRIKAAAEALGKNKEDLQVLIVQLATIYRDGKAVSMSTRKGEFISLREVMEEVGVDAARFFFLMRHIKVHLDFDLELAKKESPENPVYYIQYAHARIHSINKKAKEAGLKEKRSGFKHLSSKEDLELIKTLGTFPEIPVFCYNQLDPYPLVNYLQELAAAFHRFYDTCRVIDENEDISSERLGLCNATLIVLANGLRLIGVSTPEKM